jgi:excisionase family DNA binding protein
MKEIFNEKHYTIKEVAEILGISNTTVQTYIKSNIFKAIKLAGKWYVTESTIKTFLDSAGVPRKGKNDNIRDEIF